MQLQPRVTATGRGSMTVDVELWPESLLAGERLRPRDVYNGCC